MEIKYRIFDKEYKKYCEEPDFRWTLSRQGKLYNSENDEWHDVGKRFVVEFFTGKKDVKGIDIYEGDFLHYEGITSFGKPIKEIVSYSTERSQFMSGINPMVMYTVIPKIIGNTRKPILTIEK